MLLDLQKALKIEIKKQEVQVKDNSTSVALTWYHEFFQVQYDSFQTELVVNGYFIEYLIPKLEDLADPYEVILTFAFILCMHIMLNTTGC